MARKVKNFILANPTLVSDDFQSLQTNFQQAFGLNVAESIIMFVSTDPNGSLNLVFAKVKPNGQPDLTAKTVSFALPCPPYCGQRGSINVLTTT
jgi:hypothetical protein